MTKKLAKLWLKNKTITYLEINKDSTPTEILDLFEAVLGNDWISWQEINRTSLSCKIALYFHNKRVSYKIKSLKAQVSCWYEFYNKEYRYFRILAIRNEMKINKLKKQLIVN